MTAARLLARTVRGIESVVAEEIRRRGLGRVERLGHREVWFRSADPGPEVLGLDCADDVFLVAAAVSGIGRDRSALRLLAEAAGNVPVEPLLALRQRCGGRPRWSTVDVSASFLGRRNYSRYDVEDAVGGPLAAAVGLPYHGRRGGVAPPPGGLSWRVTVADDRALVALRIAERPLHRRQYRQQTRAGSLHPPLAAAMVRLAQPHQGARLLDPCCGVGTIPVEAARTDPTLSIVGSDRDPASVTGAVANGAGTTVSWAVADAGRLPVATGSVDVVVSNPPWGQQVPPSGVLAQRPERFWRELRRVLRPGGRAVLLLPDANTWLPQAADAGMKLVDRRPVSLFGSHPEIVALEVAER
ncbi:methyltransferase domain-containing protein [Streptoalloteichus hindustanus]|uniref:23S rRNA G2445 N2-methylase RlmL n=1 Tax=Streptoalloteichus hindustanus TaxID=2017 RepID=A0A1M5FPQ8_STRHI|nr:methyltransferase domain-containing protein [Streptoalloteichus hindustanus]SHF93409.1 23S rRNA G2445 N2-methylase RlmL [Streptoalloteichus hindustanus]